MSATPQIISSKYVGILKSTFLFSFVRVFQIIIGIVRNKIIAIILGTEGIGLIGIFTTTIQFMQTGAGLGISESAVRDISETNGQKDKEKLSRIISITNRVIIGTSVLGVVLGIILSPLISQWTLGNKTFTLSFVLLSLVIGLNILSEGQLAILKGMRQLKSLAYSSLIGSIIGLITSLPMYYFFGKAGIVPSLIIASLSSLYFSNMFVKRIKIDKKRISFKALVNEASPMIKMGIALMLVAFLGSLFNLIIAAYIRSHSGLETVGIYNAGTTIITSYFAIVITAMTTDYYPRISEIHRDNQKLNDEVNHQSLVGLTLIFPIAVVFVLLSPFIIKLLYTEKFLETIKYTDYAVLGTIIIVCSNCMGMILLAKQEAKVFIFTVIGQRVVLMLINIYLFNMYGMLGLGVAYLITGVIHIVLMSVIMKSKYSIRFNKEVFVNLLCMLAIICLSIFIRNIKDNVLLFFVSTVLIIITLLYSYMLVRKNMGIDIVKIITKKIIKI